MVHNGLVKSSFRINDRASKRAIKGTNQASKYLERDSLKKTTEQYKKKRNGNKDAKKRKKMKLGKKVSEQNQKWSEEMQTFYRKELN